MTPFFIELAITICSLSNPGSCARLDPIVFTSETQCTQIGKQVLAHGIQSPANYKVVGYKCNPAEWEDI